VLQRVNRLPVRERFLASPPESEHVMTGIPSRPAARPGAGRRSAGMNRKLIRPDLSEIKDQMTARSAGRLRKPVPPEQTNAESYYYLKQMTNKTKMVVVLKDGEEIRGIIEWYDKHALKVHRATLPNILLLKDNVKYMYKENEDKDQDQD
jgi:hypothetical protein